jgi:hypothetical protein
VSKRLPIILIITLCIVIPCFAQGYSRLYLAGYSPFIYNQIDLYKINNGQNLNKQKPYIIPGFGTKSTYVINLDSMQVIISTTIGDDNMYPDIIMSLDDYIAGIESKVFHKTLLSQVLTLPDQTTAQTGGLIKDITIDLPNIAIPKSIRRILGNKAGRLNLDGTQKITLSGTSTKRKIIPIYETNRGSRFELKMQQDTSLRLTGTIGEKIEVNLKYNSNQEDNLFDPNNINIKYTGDEDEVIQSIEAGNITLALGGSRYISYSTSSQGLFGVTTKMKVGALDLTMIASKEEGQKNTQTYIGQSQADSTIIYSKNYATRTFYYLEKPQDVYALYTNADSNIPEGWKNNAIKTSAGAWLVQYPALLPKDGTVKVYLDDGDATNNVAAIPGERIILNPADTTNFYIPYYDELIEGTDFITNYSTGTLEILKPVDRLYTIATKYTRKDNILVPENNGLQDGILHVKVLRVRNQEHDITNASSTWDYQMRNIYSMGITNVKKDGFLLEVYSENTDRTRNYNVPDSLSFPGLITYNDYLRLDSNGDGKVNGDDTTVNLAAGYVLIPLIKPFYPLNDTLIYNEETENISYEAFKHFISVKGKIGRDMISLGQTGVLEGSVKVKVDGVTQKENSDYLVDYDMGQITFLSAAGKNPDAKIEIDYEFRSGFVVAQKSLAGIRADWNISENSKLGGTIMYRSETVDEKRPKIGSENMQLFLADIDGSTTWKPGFITKWIDALPLIKTTAESRIALSGEAAVTIPNITGDSKHKKEAFIDDMEGILDSYPLGLSFSTWSLGSKPWQTSLVKGRINWYNPLNIRMRNVYDETTLNDTEKDENVTVLAMKLFPNTAHQSGTETWSYGGIMKYIGNQLDFSNKKYIELLIKADNYGEIPPNITLHVDLGDISEDFYTEYGGLNVLNTEDKNQDGEVTTEEDTGLDGLTDSQPGNDPNDNWIFEDADPQGDYLHKNGTENNSILDTEDLDNNGVLNQLDRYLSYSTSVTNINPSQNPYIVDYIQSTKYILLRIPLNNPSAYEIVNNSSSGILPTLKKVSYVRLWAETDKTARILIASASIVGNKWEDFHIRDFNNNIINTTNLNANNELYISGIADNQKNSHYTSPKNTFYKELDKPTLEQSLTLTTQNIQPGHQVLLKQRLFDYYDLRSYEKIRFWVFPENGKDLPYNSADSLNIVFRIGSDSLNYYQVRQPLKVLEYVNKMPDEWWVELDYNLQDFSSIKDTLNWDEEYFNNGRYFSYEGTPTLTNIREFVLGIQRKSTDPNPYNGIIYFDDIRVANPYEDYGWAGRISLNSVFADVSTFDVEYEQKSLNFNPTIQRGRTQNTSFATSNSLRIVNKYFLEKIFPETWGLRLPLSLDRNYSISVPRYRANSDVLRSKIVDETDKNREKTENLNYSATIGISQVSSSKSSILAYTLNKMSLTGKVSQTNNNTATTRDSTFAWQGTYNYNFNLPESFLSVPVSKNYRVRLIPGGYTNSLTMNVSIPDSYNWEKRDTLETWYRRSQTFPTKYITTDNGITWTLTSDFNTSFRLMTKRDLEQKNYFKTYNVGKETEYNQDIGANYSPVFFPKLMTLTNSIASRYTENQRKYTENTTDGLVDLYQKDGNSTRTIRINLTLLNSSLFSEVASKIRNPASLDISQEKNKEEVGKELKRDYQDEKKKEEEEKKKKESPEYKKEPDTKDNIEKKSPDLNNADLPKTDVQDSTSTKTASDGNKDKSSNSFSPAYIFEMLSKVKNVTATYQNGFTQIFTRKDKRPNYAFQLGLPNQIPNSFLDSRANEDTYTLASGIALSRRIDSTMNYSYSLSQRFASASNQIVSVTFPDITLTVSDVENMLGLSKYMQNTRLNSNYQFTLRQNGDINWKQPKQETKTSSFNPLLSLTTNLAKDVQTTLSYTLSNSDNITDMTEFQILRTTNTQSVTGNVSYSFRSSTGIELPFVKRKINIKNELTSSLSILYENNYDTTKGRLSTQVERNSSRINISPSATYQFDQNIKGGLTSGYELNTDKKLDDYTRIFRLGFWVEITL